MIGAFQAGVMGSSTLWTPAAITTALWLDAADSSTMFDAVSSGSLVSPDGSVARWTDKSGNANHATQSTGDSRPIRKTSDQNSLGVLRFDGSNDYLIGAATPCSSNDKTIFAVTKSANAVGGNILQNRSGVTGASGVPSPAFLARAEKGGSKIFVSGDTTATNISIATDLLTAWQNYNIASWIQRSSDRAVFYWNNGTNYTTSGTLVSEEASAGYHVAAIKSGANIFGYYNGDVCELIAIDAQASTDICQRIEGYLAHKWGLIASLPSGHPYKSVAPMA